MGLDDFKPDNPFKVDPPQATKWRYEEPELPNWERHIIIEYLNDEDPEGKVIILRTSTPDVPFINYIEDAWLSSKLYVSLSDYR